MKVSARPIASGRGSSSAEGVVGEEGGAGALVLAAADRQPSKAAIGTSPERGAATTGEGTMTARRAIAAAAGRMITARTRAGFTLKTTVTRGTITGMIVTADIRSSGV